MPFRLLPVAIRPRLALAIIFIMRGFLLGMRGFLLGNWIARIPAIAEHLGVSRTELGSVLIAGAIGALVAFQTSAPRIGQWGTARSIAVFGLVWAACFPLATFAPGPVAFCAIFLVFGFANGTTDVALNAQAVEIERRIDTPILSSMHGMFSIGALVGTAAGGGLAALGVPIQQQFVAIAAVVIATWLLMTPYLVHDDRVAPVGRATRRRPVFSIGPQVLWPLGAIAFCCALVEEALADWGALFLTEDLGANPGLAAMGYTLFSCTMLIGRLGGDRLVARFGAVAVLRAGSVLGTGGILLGVAINTPWAFLLAFALAGLGFSTTIPVVYRAAGSMPGVDRAAGVAAVATMCYLAFLVGPPAMGLIADHMSLRVAFTLVAATASLVILLAPAVNRPARDPGSDPEAATSPVTAQLPAQ